MSIKRKIEKSIHRFFRCLTFRKGIYGNYGEGCVFKKGAFLDEGSSIGSYNYIGKNTDIGTAIIGSYCSFGDYVTIGPGEHPLNQVSTSCRVMNESGVQYCLVEKPVVIGNDVWIGTKATVLRGVTVSDGAVVAAGSIVKKDVPPFAVVAGVPAKIIKFRKNGIEAEKILASKWWEYPLKKAVNVIKEIELDKG